MKSKAIKILHITYHGGIGGIGTVIKNIILNNNYTNISHEVCSATTDGLLTKDMERRGIKTYAFSFKNGYDLLGAYKLYKFIKKENYDVIHLHFFTPLLRLVAWLTVSPKIILTEHGTRFGNRSIKPTFLLKIFNTLLRNTADFYVAVSNTVSKEVISEKLVPFNKIKVIHNGVNIEEFLPKARNNNLAKLLGIENKDKVLISIGRLTEVKDFKSLLNTISIVRKYIPYIKVLIVGNGPLLQNLKEYCVELGIEKNVIWTGFRNDIPDLINLSDFLVLSSKSETFSLVAAEAMACGKPVISFSIPALMEIIKNNVTGVLVSERTSKALAKKIIYLLNNKNMQNKMGISGRKAIEEKYSSKICSQKYNDFYLELLNRN